MKVLFLVYESAWWGCFDEIYRDCLYNKNYDCYVLPIPVYKKDQNGQLLNADNVLPDVEFLPDYINYYDHKEINLEQLQPDIIFIHNPFDNNNNIKSVDPCYYSENLKKFTRELVYVPHYLFSDFVPEYLKDIQVYKNVDKIHIQNEKLRSQFPKIFEEKLFLSQLQIKKYFDTIIESNDFVPKEWEIIYYKEKNTKNRKTLLYHMGFDELSKGNLLVLEKSKTFLKYFKDRGDVLLVFHPETAIEDNLNMLSVDVAEGFLELIKWYLRENIGIYDKTENIYNLAAVCDGYVGEKHPVMNYFSVLEKKIILLGHERLYIPDSEEKLSFSFRDFVEDGEDIWFIPNEFLCLCKMNLSTGNLEVVKEIPRDKEDIILSYSGIEKIDDDFIIIPFNENGILRINMKTDECEKLFFKNPTSEHFNGSVKYGNKLFIICRRYSGILVYDFIENTFEYINDWIEEVKKYIQDEDRQEPYFVWGYSKVGNDLYMAGSNANIILKLNLETYEYKVFEVGPTGNKYYTIAQAENYLYLFPYKGNEIVRFNIVDGSWIIWKNEIVAKETLLTPYRKAFYKDKNLILFSSERNKVYVVNMDGKEIKLADNKSKQNSYYMRWYTNIMLAKELSNRNILVNNMRDCSVEIYANILELKIEKTFPCRIKKEDYKHYAIRNIENKLENRKNNILYESDDINQIMEFFTAG